MYICGKYVQKNGAPYIPNIRRCCFQIAKIATFFSFFGCAMCQNQPLEERAPPGSTTCNIRQRWNSLICIKVSCILPKARGSLQIRLPHLLNGSSEREGRVFAGRQRCKFIRRVPQTHTPKPKLWCSRDQLSRQPLFSRENSASLF